MEGRACADPGARTPIGVEATFNHVLFYRAMVETILATVLVMFNPVCVCLPHIGLSGVPAPVSRRCGVHIRHYSLFLSFGPSGVRALPLAAGRNVGGYSTWHYFSFSLLLSESLTFLPERRQLGLRNFAWAPKSTKY